MEEEDFFKTNARDWTRIHHEIFGNTIPSRYEWTKPEDIVAVLNKIGRVPNSNHSFFPMGGGLDLEGARLAEEPRCIELNFGLRHVVRPDKLIFERVDDNQEWNYFRLETLELEPSGLYELSDDAYDEELVDLGNGEYIHRNYWDEGSYDGKPLPKNARPLTRLFRGAIVIFKKMSWYNHASGKFDAYDARHEALGASGFRQHVEEAFKAIGNRPMVNPRFHEE